MLGPANGQIVSATVCDIPQGILTKVRMLPEASLPPKPKMGTEKGSSP